MPQSNIIFAFLLIAFIVFVTMRGELPQYWGMMLGKCNNPAGGAGAAPLLPTGTPESMLGAQGQSPGVPGETGTYGQAKANQYFNAFLHLFGGGQ